MYQSNVSYPIRHQNGSNIEVVYTNRRQNKVEQHCNSLKEYLREFCETSSIQGLSHMVKDITLIERIWWISVFIMGVLGSYYMVYQILDKWQTTPVLVSFATKELPINEIPFPAVTICPEAKISRMCLNYTHILTARKNIITFSHTTLKENEYFDYMALLCRSDNHEGTFSLVNKSISQLLDYVDDAESDEGQLEVGLNDYSDFLAECAAVKLEEAMCQWMGVFMNCTELMTPILTDEGLCYTFNMYDVRDIYSDTNTMQYYQEGNRQLDWKPDTGYRQQTGNLEKMYPRRAFLGGAKNAFVAVFLTHKKDMNYACRDFSIQGIRVTLHTPLRIPRPSQVFFSVGLDRLTTAAVTPTQTQTSKKIKSYTAEKRNCYFAYERKLKYFKIYSQGNCNVECWTNYTIHKCGCVNFYMPRDNFTEVCNLVNRYCLENARLSYTTDILKELKSRSDVSKNKDLVCNCLPLCSDLTYNVEIATSEWDFNNADDPDYDLDRERLSEYHASGVKVFFKNVYFLPTVRDELYGITDVIANTGGALGLIIGFSLFSIAEIIYFLSVKLIENYRTYGYWAGPRPLPSR